MFKKRTVNVNSGDEKDKPDSFTALRALSGAIVAGFLVCVAFASQAFERERFMSIAVAAIMIGAASLGSGTLLGFLFGIPRTLQQQGDHVGSGASEKGTEDQIPRINYLANTNLEQISDWLTKILVGVGLTQIPSIRTAIVDYAAMSAPALGNGPAAAVFAVALLLYFVVCGFLFGYLWTRLFLPVAFRRADLSALASQVEKATNEAVRKVDRKLEALEKQANLDAAALSLAQRQLHPSSEIPPVSQEQLNDAIESASRPIKIQIFNQAQRIRSERWRRDKSKMQLTVPIFRALVESDTEDRFHRNHGQLGFALKDQDPPNFREAEAELTKAITLRGDWEENGWLFYEFNRATCRINLDEDFAAGEVSRREVREEILADLRAAAQSDLLKLLLADPLVKRWMERNGVTADNLQSGKQ